MKRGILVSILSLVIGAVAVPAFADDNSAGQTSMPIEKAKDQSNKVQGAEEADAILTNNKLRAETGSLSRWSVATSMEYLGGTISRPFSDYRPNIQNVNGQSPVSDLDGGVNIKYNMGPRDSLLLGETVRMITPQSSIKYTPQSPDPATHQAYRGQKFDNYNPSLNYQHIYKLGGFQSYYQVGPTIYTQSDYTDIGYLGNMAIYNVNAYDIGHTRFTVGVESNAGYNWFRTPQAYPGYTTLDQTKAYSSDYTAFAYPYLEYRINDKLNIRTVGMWFSIEHTLTHDGDYTRWTKDVAMQSVGLGISVTRDFFLYPNVQFIPDQIRGKQTNIGLASNINLF